MNHIKALRDKKNITQVKLAQLLGISRMSISHYENGTRTPRPGVLVRIADYFGVSVDSLLRNQDGTNQ